MNSSSSSLSTSVLGSSTAQTNKVASHCSQNKALFYVGSDSLNDAFALKVRIQAGAYKPPSDTATTASTRINTNNSLDQLRRQIRTALEARLQEKHSTVEREKILKAAKCIEHFLYMQQKNGQMDDYADLSNLKDRLAPLLRCLMKRKSSRVTTGAMAGTAAPVKTTMTSATTTTTLTEPLKTLSPDADRRTVLRHVLGGNNYLRAVLLTQQIQRLRLQQASSPRSQMPPRGSSDNQACPTKVETMDMPQLPPAVKNLLFHVPLIEAMDNMPIQEIIRVPPEQWTSWMEQAVQTVDQYQQWKRHGN